MNDTSSFEYDGTNNHDVLTEFCPVYAHAVDILGRRWMGLILRVLLTGPHRFNEILGVIPGLSDPMLSQRLRELESEGLVMRVVVPSMPVRVEYRLTEAGSALEHVVREIGSWAGRWLTATPSP
ncbi:MAG: helix-turn-helix domain-containing protein [Herpetosiphon sp.]